MILLDENINEDQRLFLEKWKIKVKQIGVELNSKGVQDGNIISLLTELKGILFVTKDSDFFKKSFCHKNYCIVFLDIDKREVALFVKRFLKHPEFNTKSKCLGKIIRMNHTNIIYYQTKSNQLTKIDL